MNFLLIQAIATFARYYDDSYTASAARRPSVLKRS
jgi:hypothetical protein